MTADRWKKLLSRVLVRDRGYALILGVGFVYSIAVSVIPLFRAVPCFPLQLLVWVLILLLYIDNGIPDTVKRWFFYVFLTLSYQSLRSVVVTYAMEFHGRGIAAFEAELFGRLPSEILQNLLYTRGQTAWYDAAFAVLHASLFALPILAPLVVLLLRGKERMKRATVAFVLLSLAGYLTYVLFPVTPPWMASLEGFVPPLDRVVFSALREITNPWLASAFQPSPRGAMPSLHTAVPFLMLLVFRRELGRKALWISVYVAAICFEIVYGAEHYVLDIVAGIAYAILAYWLVYRVLYPDERLQERAPEIGERKPQHD
ncbi:inositol phosphorylceramide synthase [Candidatus Fermentibacterales bacterium]|nr:inositol phosphorylceramide synthase [Candidatus Fermentibacterales bacterium]